MKFMVIVSLPESGFLGRTNSLVPCAESRYRAVLVFQRLQRLAVFSRRLSGPFAKCGGKAAFAEKATGKSNLLDGHPAAFEQKPRGINPHREQILMRRLTDLFGKKPCEIIGAQGGHGRQLIETYRFLKMLPQIGGRHFQCSGIFFWNLPSGYRQVGEQLGDGQR